MRTYAHAYCAREVKRRVRAIKINGVGLNGNRRDGAGACCQTPEEVRQGSSDASCIY